MSEELTNWQAIVIAIMNADAPKGHDRYTYEIIESKTDIKVFTLCRLFTGNQRKLHYDAGVKLMALYTKLKRAGKLTAKDC